MAACAVTVAFQGVDAVRAEVEVQRSPRPAAKA